MQLQVIPIQKTEYFAKRSDVSLFGVSFPNLDRSVELRNETNELYAFKECCHLQFLICL